MPRLSKCECVLLEQYRTAPSPSRDYFGIKITENEIHLFKWRICRAPILFPSLQKLPLKSIEDDPSLITEIKKIFEVYQTFTQHLVTVEFIALCPFLLLKTSSIGNEIAVEIKKIASGTKDYLSHLPSNIICHILCQLDLREIPVVARVCKKLANQITGNDDLWFMLFVKYHGEPSNEDINESKKIGWRKLMYFKRNPTLSRINATSGLKVSGKRPEKAKSTVTFVKTQKQVPKVSHSSADLKKQAMNRNISKSVKNRPS